MTRNNATNPFTTPTMEQLVFLNRWEKRVEAYLNDGADEPAVSLLLGGVADLSNTLIGMELIEQEVQRLAALAAERPRYCRSQVFAVAVRPLLELVLGPAAVAGPSVLRTHIAYDVATVAIFETLPPCNGCGTVCRP